MCTVKIYLLVVCQGRLKSLVETLRDQSLFIGGGGGGGQKENPGDPIFSACLGWRKRIYGNDKKSISLVVIVTKRLIKIGKKWFALF
jgi:hypothetical protein